MCIIIYICLSDIGEEWEEDLDIDLTEEDVKTAEDVIKNFSDNIELDV